MRFLIKPRDRIYLKGYELVSFANDSCKNLSGTYHQKPFDYAKK